jgi:endo-1,4-beta-xylanase
VPSYVKDLDSNQLKEIFESHILTIIKRYQSSVFVWDVVNEAINSDGTPRKSIWLKHLGADYIKDAFILAHLVNPKAKLFYNDYDLTMPGPKFNSAYELVKDLLKKKIPIHGIGLQMHLRPDFKQSEEGLRLVIQKFSELGLEVHLTEIDIAIATPSSLNDREVQAKTFKFIGSICSEFPSCTSLSLWGLNDSASWIPSHFKGLGEATLFDKDLNKKSAYYEFLRGLKSRN